MKCISKTDIQKYIDNECSNSEYSSIEQHLAICISCRYKYEEQLQLSLLIKQSITELTDRQKYIPTFKKPHATKKFKLKYEITYTISAACIILFMLIFVDKNQNNSQYESILSNTYEFDSNQPITEQALVINYVDPEGNHSEFYIQ